MREDKDYESSVEYNLLGVMLLCQGADRLARSLSPDFDEGIIDGMCYAPTSTELGGELTTTIGMAASRLRGTFEQDGVLMEGGVVLNQYSVQTELKAQVEYAKLPEDVKDQLARVVEDAHLVLDATTVYEILYELNYTFADDGTFDQEITVRYLADGHDIIDDEGEPVAPDMSDGSVGSEDVSDSEDDKNLQFLADLSKQFEEEFKTAQEKDPIHIIEDEVDRSLFMTNDQHQERCRNILEYIRSTQTAAA